MNLSRFHTAAVIASVLVAVAVFSSAASADGNSANAKLCQKGGWISLVRADNTPFTSQDECVSYGAQGGTPMPPITAQSICQSNGGLYTESGVVGGELPTGWTCSMYPSDINKPAGIALSGICIADGGTPIYITAVDGFGTAHTYGLTCELSGP